MATPPLGTWIKTCRNWSVSGDTLTAQCEDLHLNYQQTSLAGISNCSPGSIANVNGVLKCVTVAAAAAQQPVYVGNCGYAAEGHCACSACRCCSPADYIKQAGFTILTPDTVAENYAIRFGSPSDRDSLFYPKTIIMSHRIAWWKTQPGDCGVPQSANTPLLPQISRDVGFAGSALGAATGAATLGGFSGVAGALALGGPITAIAAAVLLPLSFIEQHHAAAVAKETSMGCAVSASWNQFSAALEKSLASGAIGVSDANQYLDAAVQQIRPMIDSIAISRGDAGYMMRYGLLGLQQLYKDSEIARFAAMAQKGQGSVATPLANVPMSAGFKIGIVVVAGLVVGALLLK